jgi:tRNA pseudouridine55 synthase
MKNFGTENIAHEDGFMLIDKEKDWTSFDVVAKLRSITKIKKIGHAGTLDPFATGLLIVAIGRQATRKISEFMKLDKEYEATLFLGKISDTHDSEGVISDYKSSFVKKIMDIFRDKNITKEKVEKILKKFIGKQNQIPPMFSAKKIQGKKLYELARKGITIKRKSAPIKIFCIELVDYAWPYLKIKVRCSSGTYMRTLGSDIGKALHCGAYVETLRRTKIGDCLIENAITINNINKYNWKNFLFL